MDSPSRLPVHPLVLVLGAVGALLLAFGLLGALSPGPIEWFPVLSEPGTWVSLVAIGAVLLIVEVVMIVKGARSRDPWD